MLFVFVLAFAFNALSVPVSFTESQESSSAYRQDTNVVGTPSDLSHTRSLLPLFLDHEISLVLDPVKSLKSQLKSTYQRALSDKRISVAGVYSQGPPVI